MATPTTSFTRDVPGTVVPCDPDGHSAACAPPTATVTVGVPVRPGDIYDAPGGGAVVISLIIAAVVIVGLLGYVSVLRRRDDRGDQ